MANTYAQIYIHIVFAVQGGQNLIGQEHSDELQKYITGVISDVVRHIKAGSSGFINDRRWVAGRFSWQEGFGAFSYSHSQLRTVIRYIQNQQEHHQRKSFNQKYVELLKRFNVPHQERYRFQPVEPD
jgi:putative transposase